MSKKVYFVSLTITLDDEEQQYGNPDEWDWATLLDLPWDDVLLEDVREVE